MNDRNLRDLYRHVVNRPPEGQAGCPSPEDILALAERILPDDRRLSLLDHVAGCVRCREELRLIEAFAETRRVTSWSRKPLVLLAASLALVVGATVFWQQARKGEPDVLRGLNEDIVLVAPLGNVQPGTLRFTWRSSPPVKRYRVEVMDANGAVAFSGEGPDTTIALPSSTRLSPQSEYRWRVIAFLPDGTRRQSLAQPFQISVP